MTDLARVLWVDDDPAFLRGVDSIFRCGLFAQSGEAGLAILRHEAVLGRPVAVLVADVVMPGMDGVELCRRAREVSPRTRRVLLSGLWDALPADHAVNVAAAHAIVHKPATSAELRAVLDSLETERRSETPAQPMAAVTDREIAAAKAHNSAREALLSCVSPAPFRR